MGLGKRYQFNNEKKDQKVPGPGAYADCDPQSIVSVARSQQRNLGPGNNTFGSTKSQQEKL